MKRLVSLLIGTALVAALVIFATAASAGFDAAGVTRYTIRGDGGSTHALEAAGDTAVQALESFLAAADKSASVPAGAAAIATVETATASGSRTYTLLQSGDAYFLSQGGRGRAVSYDAFEALVRAAGGVEAFYKYAAVPTATAGGSTLGVVDHAYSYRRVNGAFVRRGASPDTAAPTLSADTLVRPAFARRPDSVSYAVYREGADTPLWTGTESQAAAYSPGEGTFLVQITATYNQDNCRGTVTYAYRHAAEAPISFTIDADHASQGEVVVLRVSGADASKVAATATTNIDFTPTFFSQSDGSQIALLPVSVYTAAGTYTVDVTCGRHSAKLTFNNRERKFEVQHLTVAESTAAETILSQQANAEYEQVIAPLRPVADSRQYWSGRFILPTSDERVTSSFGVIRYTNGSSTPARHNALDFAVPRGTPVAASNSGRVLYAGNLQLTGNTVLIEHGYGLKTWYYHMDTLTVSTGDMVTKGRQIGTVGSTGFSTGPHMHFAMSVNNVFINPYTLIRTDLLAD